MELKGVTLSEFSKWMEKNEHRTWSHDKFGVSTTGENLPLRQAKYFYISFDTRDMVIFNIKTASQEFKVDIRDGGREEILGKVVDLGNPLPEGFDPKDKSILDLLEFKMDKAREERKNYKEMPIFPL